jgi:hypothetical protein
LFTTFPFNDFVPFARSKVEDTEPVESPLHKDFQDFTFFKVDALICKKIWVGERIVDTIKRIHQSAEPIEDMAKWASKLFARGGSCRS